MLPRQASLFQQCFKEPKGDFLTFPCHIDIGHTCSMRAILPKQQVLIRKSVYMDAVQNKDQYKPPLPIGRGGLIII